MSLPTRLLRWYDRHRRDLPWRRSRDPYRIWLSEIMLQQTRVEVVQGYYRRFLERFPDLPSLAAAPLDEVLRLWSGLGYYARARHLHAAARRIVERSGGRFPDALEEIRALPGIGRYTAGAIASIAFDRPEPLVDGNVVRVLARIFDLPGHAKDPALKERCWELAEDLVPERRPGDFNQALMELGATVCLPGRPDCSACPVSSLCRGRARAEEIPAAAPRKEKPHRHVDCALLDRGGRFLLVKRPERGLLGGLWELPAAERRGKPGQALAEALRALGLARVEVGPARVRVEHAFTHFDMTLTAFACEASGDPLAGVWVSGEELSRYGMGAAMRRVLTAGPAGGEPGWRPRGRSRRSGPGGAARSGRRGA